MNILNVGYNSTNYYLLEPDKIGLMVDTGWPGTMPRLLSVLKRKGVPFQKIRYLLATHYHPDHAGLAQEMKDQGVMLIVMDSQVEAIPLLSGMMKPSDHYREINLEGNIQLKSSESRKFLQSIGVKGEIIYTPGHTQDSVTLVLDEGIAFTGDLTPPIVVAEEARSQVEASWAKIRSYGVKTICPGHGPVPQIK